MSMIREAAERALTKAANYDWMLPINSADAAVSRGLGVDGSPVRSGFRGGLSYEQARDRDYWDSFGSGAGAIGRFITAPGRWLADRMNGVPTASQRATQMTERQRMFNPQNAEYQNSPNARTEALMPGARDAALARADAESPLARPGARRSRVVPTDPAALTTVAGLRPSSGNVAMYGQRGNAMRDRMPNMPGGDSFAGPAGPPSPGLGKPIGLASARSTPVKPPELTSTFAGKQQGAGVKPPRTKRASALGDACAAYFDKRASVGDFLWEAAKFVPFVGAVPSGIDAVGHAARGNWGTAALEAGMGALSMFPGAGQAGRLGAAGARLAGAGRAAAAGLRAGNAGAMRVAGRSALGATGQAGRALGIPQMAEGLTSAVGAFGRAARPTMTPAARDASRGVGTIASATGRAPAVSRATRNFMQSNPALGVPRVGAHSTVNPARMSAAAPVIGAGSPATGNYFQRLLQEAKPGLSHFGRNLTGRLFGETALTSPLAFRNATGLGGLGARLFTSPATIGQVAMGFTGE